MESRSRVVMPSQPGLPPRAAISVTFSRDTSLRKIECIKPQQLSRKPEPKFENVGKIVEKDADPVLASLVNYHSKLHAASGRSFDLVVGKLCHLLKTNGYYLDSKYKDTMDAMFCTIRTLIIDQEKSELSRTRLLEILELRAKKWGHDPLELPQAQPRDLPSPLKSPEVTHPHDRMVIQSQRPLQQGVAGRYSPIPLPPLQVAPPSPDMEAMTHVAKSIPFPDDTDDEQEDDDQWLTTSEMTYESDSSEEFIMPEHDMDEWMTLESTSELDAELSRLLSAKLPDSYRRRVNDGKPVRYTRSFLLNLWESPFSKEMPSVLKHTISHSDVAFIIQRHAFSDPRVLFQQGSRDDVLLLSKYLQTDPNLRGRHSSCRTAPDPAASGGGDTRQRTLSWPQGAGARSRLDVPGGGGEGLMQGAEGARYRAREEKIDSLNSATLQGAGRNINKGDAQGGGPEASMRSSSPDDWRRAGARKNKGEQDPSSGRGEEVSLRPQSPKDWRRPSSPSSPSASNQEGTVKVRFELPGDKKDDESQTDRSSWEQAPASSHVLLTPRQILGKGAQETSPRKPSLTPPPDVNNNGFAHKSLEGVSDNMSSAPAQQPETLTFREVFKEVIEKGITTGAPGPAADIQAQSRQGYIPLTVTYKPTDPRVGGRGVGLVEQANLANVPSGRSFSPGWRAKHDWS
ncbi:uncharacterized protein LOC100889470 [Strongylocentrotus purpuratus]|uniref:Uncharacterized protein n=1 Tax=Strongylocentrotus purpuratus TaxID=7668 RepID=A0A7M7HKF2_STRPU|nr:uncharacterized protein LOC100889470 [Strongylocentrotus purpuratus]